MKRRGFTLIELLVVVAIIALLIAILLPSLGKARELANRGTCAANVRGIAQSMHVYGADNNDVYPCVPANSANTASSVQYKLASGAQATGFGTTDATYQSMYSAGTASAAAGSPMACLWILCIRGDVAPKQFLCKSDPIGSAASPLLTSANLYNTNFNDATNVTNSDQHYSYSFAYPWTKAASSAPGGWWKATSDASIVLMADMNPKNGSGTSTNLTATNTAFPGTKQANSIHHQRDGENVSYGDAHAEFVRSPFVGQNGDNIYTAGVSGPAYTGSTSDPIISTGQVPTTWNPGSSGSYDTILVPVADVQSNVRF